MTIQISGRIQTFKAKSPIAPVGGVTVELFQAGVAIAPPMTSGGDGTYTTGDLTRGDDYTLEPSAEGYAFDPPRASYHSITSSAVQNFVAVPNSISGNTIDLETGKPIGSVSIVVSGRMVGEKSQATVESSKDAGRYQVGGLLTGEKYTLTYSHPDFIAAESRRTIEFGTSQTLPLYLAPSGKPILVDIFDYLSRLGIGLLILVWYLYRRWPGRGPAPGFGDDDTVGELVQQLVENGDLDPAWVDANNEIQALWNRRMDELDELENQAFSDALEDGQADDFAAQYVEQILSSDNPAQFISELNQVAEDELGDVLERLLEDPDSLRDHARALERFLEDNDALSGEPMEEGGGFVGADSLEEIEQLEMAGEDLGEGYSVDGTSQELIDALQAEVEGLEELSEGVVAALEAILDASALA